jgi:hypothetical protein
MDYNEKIIVISPDWSRYGIKDSRRLLKFNFF